MMPGFRLDPAEIVLLIVGGLLTIFITTLFILIIRRAMRDGDGPEGG